MRKPVKHTKKYYNYFECRDYLENKYNFKERDFENGRDFWYFVWDHTELSNGSLIKMYEEWKEGAAPWEIEILDYFLDEFGEGEHGNRKIEFWVEW